MSTNTEVNHDKLMELFGDVFNDVAGSIAVMMSYLGDQTGVYRQWINSDHPQSKILPVSYTHLTLPTRIFV